MPLCRLNVTMNRCDHIFPQAAVNEIALFFKLCPVLWFKIRLILGKQLLIALIGFLRAGKSAGRILQNIGISCARQRFCLFLLLFAKRLDLCIFLCFDKADNPASYLLVSVYTILQRLLHGRCDLRLLRIADIRLL